MTLVNLHTAGELLHVRASSLESVKAVTLFAFRAAAAVAAAHEGAFKSQMKPADCEALCLFCHKCATFRGR